MQDSERRPERIQRRRSKGWKMPANTVCVTRGTKWGNPYSLKFYTFAHANGTPAPWNEEAAREMALRDYEHWLEVCLPGQAIKDAARAELRGKNLACWCALDAPCHADVLLEIANRPTCEAV